MPWNSRKVGTTWAIHKDGIDQIGCVHTSQGLEFDYVGVIIGNDLKYDNHTDQFYSEWNSYKDSKGKQSIRTCLVLLSVLCVFAVKILGLCIF